VAFVDALKEEFYPVGNYDDQVHEMDNFASGERPDGVRVHQYLPYLALKLGIRDSEWHLVLKYHKWPT
jgi:hypothetical protein